MHGSLDRSDESRNRRSWSIEFFVLPVLVAIGLIVGLVIRKPLVSAWIPDAPRAELARSNSSGVIPAEPAQPDMQIRAVTAH